MGNVLVILLKTIYVSYTKNHVRISKFNIELLKNIDIAYFTVWHSPFTFSYLSHLNTTPNFRLKKYISFLLVSFFTILHSLYVTLHPFSSAVIPFISPSSFLPAWQILSATSHLWFCPFFFLCYHFSFNFLQLSSYLPTFSYILSYFIPSNFAIFTISYFTPTSFPLVYQWTIDIFSSLRSSFFFMLRTD